jgi:putative GTP pyrophosphokinase
MLADCLLRQDDIKLFEKKDYIANPKENGYRSLHLIIEIPIFLQNEKRPVKVEIQLRTIAMEFWANLEHRLRYKKDIDKNVLKALSKELNECAQISAMLDLKMKNIHNQIENNGVRPHFA